MSRTAFVTGGTGFLGRHIVEQLVQAGWSVTALHRASSDVKALRGYGVTLKEGSITDADSLVRAVPEGCDAVFHVAGNTSFWRGGDALQTLENVDGVRFVVQACLAKKTRHLVHTSSEAAWGEQHTIPFDETAQSHAPESFINYERTKYAGELEVLKGVEQGLNATIMCPGHILGKYDANNWGRLIRIVAAEKLPGVPPGEGTWASATQVAGAHIASITKGRSGERYLLGGVHASYLDAVRIAGELTGKKVPAKETPAWMLRALGRVSQWGSYFTRKAPTVTPEMAAATTRPPHLFKSDKAIRELGYQAVPLADMMRETYDWLKAEGLLAR